MRRSDAGAYAPGVLEAFVLAYRLQNIVLLVTQLGRERAVGYDQSQFTIAEPSEPTFFAELFGKAGEYFSFLLGSALGRGE